MRLAIMAATALLAGCVSVQSTEVAPPPKPRAPVRFVNPPQVAAPVGLYSQGAIVPEGYRLIAIAGQVGVDAQGALAATPERQYRQALENVVAIVESEGGARSDIVKLNTYAVGPLDITAVRSALQDVLGEARPASTFVYVDALVRPEWRVEVEAWAAVPAK